MNTNKYVSFVKNTFIFSLSSLGSKAATLILVPMYSYTMTLAEYGEVDIFLTLVMLLLPIITASLYESVQKFCIEQPKKRKEVLSTAIFVFLCSVAVLGGLVISIYLMFWHDEKIILFFLILTFIAFYEFFSKYAKGVGKEFQFAISNIGVALVMLFMNYYLVYLLEKGVEGVLLSQLCAYVAGVIFLFLNLRLYKHISFYKFDYLLLGIMLKLSSPLILNAAMWWVFDASDRWILLYFRGAAEVGLYSVSFKLAVVLLLIHTVLFQAWQISAIAHKNDENSKDFYSKILEFYTFVVVFFASVLISINKVVLGIVLSADFSASWEVGNLLFLSTVFFCISSFFGVFYVVQDKTSRALISSIISAVLNLILNIILIPLYGASGAAVATILSTLFLLCFRVIDTRRLVSFDYKKSLVLFLVLLLIAQIVFMSLGIYYVSYLITSALFIFTVLKFRFNFEHFVRLYVK